MKTTRTMLFALTLLGTLAGTSSASARTSVSVGVHTGSYGRTSVDLGFFYDDLAPYGNWIERPRYGWVWTPSHVSNSWRPYQDGRWVWTEDGWTWVSDEPYGWATYHYGRWYDDPDYGWGWVPGDQWAPAWVSWQEADDYVGWAPLPPYSDFRPGVTLNVRLAADDYLFVPHSRFLSARAYNYAVPRWECDRIFRRSRNVTRYGWRGGAVYNQGVSYDRIQRYAGRVPRYAVGNLGFNDRHRGARFNRNQVDFYRPEVRRSRVAPPPQRQIARRSVVTWRDGAGLRARRQERAQMAQGYGRQDRRQAQGWQGREVRQPVRREVRQREVTRSRQVETWRTDDRQRGRGRQVQTFDRRSNDRRSSQDRWQQQSRGRERQRFEPQQRQQRYEPQRGRERQRFEPQQRQQRYEPQRGRERQRFEPQQRQQRYEPQRGRERQRFEPQQRQQRYEPQRGRERQQERWQQQSRGQERQRFQQPQRERGNDNRGRDNRGHGNGRENRRQRP
jgi:hypothetical protein